MVRTWQLPVLSLALLISLVIGLDLATVSSSHVACAADKVTQQDRDDLVKLAEQEKLGMLFRKVVKVVGPAVVEVRVRKRVESQVPPNLEDFFRRFEDEENGSPGDGGTPAVPQNPRRMVPRRSTPPTFQRGLGSGIVVDAAKGIVLTNFHVVGGASDVEVIMSDGRKFTNEWVKGDPQSDLAVIKLKDFDGLTDAPLGNSDDTQVGDLVLAIGSPEGLQQTVTMGIISAKGRTTGRGGYEDFLQTDTAVNHGNSGGPLVNMRGEVVGITSDIISQTGANEGIGLAVPANMARNIMKQLIETGKVTRGYLGVMIQDVNEKLAASFQLPGTHGALVTTVMPDSPAKAAGLKEDDFILAINGKPVEGSNELRNRVAEMAPGQEITLTIFRAGQKQDVTIKITQQPAEMGQGSETGEKPSSGKKYGLDVQPYDKEQGEPLGYPADQKGVMIAQVDPDSDAGDQNLRAGIVIDQVNDQAVNNVRDFSAAVTAAKDKPIRVRIVVPKNGGKRYYLLSPK